VKKFSENENNANSEITSKNKPNGIVIDSHDNEFESGSVLSAGLDGSAGSDTDTSKAEISGNSGKDSEGRDAIPKYAAKKSASFKPVSVTKSFLAKAGSTTVPTKIAGEKG
jgi:hypothetical protein